MFRKWAGKAKPKEESERGERISRGYCSQVHSPGYSAVTTETTRNTEISVAKHKALFLLILSSMQVWLITSTLSLHFVELTGFTWRPCHGDLGRRRMR